MESGKYKKILSKNVHTYVCAFFTGKAHVRDIRTYVNKLKTKKLDNKKKVDIINLSSKKLKNHILIYNEKIKYKCLNGGR
ncbi:MAG: hypothetical protein K0Q97_2850 [Bacillota bacterium]|jgi:hypothetical protein|nr:hypothetical protein [Bacillota bacterium]